MIKKERHLTTIDNRSLDLKPAFQADVQIEAITYTKLAHQ